MSLSPENHERFMYQKQLVYILLHMLLMLGRFVYSKLKSGLVQKLALAVVLNWALIKFPSSHAKLIPSVQVCKSPPKNEVEVPF
jgi:hypothetical protein